DVVDRHTRSERVLATRDPGRERPPAAGASRRVDGTERRVIGAGLLERFLRLLDRGPALPHPRPGLLRGVRALRIGRGGLRGGSESLLGPDKVLLGGAEGR